MVEVPMAKRLRRAHAHEMRTWVALSSSLVLAGCGASSQEGAPDATLETSKADTNTADAANPFADGGPMDAMPDAVFLGDAAGPFLCNGCLCDGRTHTCGGAYPDGGMTGDGGPCADSGTACAPIPAPCLPDPSCACLLTHGFSPVCSCEVDKSGAGFIFGCTPL